MLKRIVDSRISFLAGVLLVVMAIFVVRLFWLQIVKHDQYVTIAKQNQQRSFVIPATRGKIFMMDNGKAVPVVLNKVVYDVVADPEMVEGSEKGKIVETLLDVAGGEVTDNFTKKLDNKDSRYEVLAKSVTLAQAEKIKKQDFSGVLLQRTTIRNYPENRLASQVLGFVNAEGDGQYGVEQQLNDRLKGQDGLLQSVTDVRNVPLALSKDNIRIEPKAGENIVLSIDRNIQSYAEDALKTGIKKSRATEGSVLVMDPNNGQVLAMANYPTFNPAEYYKEKNAEVFVNTITMKPYEPASVIKTFTLATGVDQGVINAGSTYVNTDCVQVADRTMCNALRGLGGTRTMQDVLDNSLNVGTIQMARRLGGGNQINLQARQKLYDYFHNKFGLGQKTGIEVSEADGYIYPPDSAEGNEVRYSAMTYGQSLSLTMIQVAAGFSSVINGGEYYQPTILSGEVRPDDSQVVREIKPLRRSISESASSQMRNMLAKARASSWIGKTDPPGYLTGGKTGTAETVVGGSYTSAETVATYIGFGGADRPEYVIMVRIAAPGKGLNLEGGIHASPVFADISGWLINYMKLAPRGV